MDATTGTSGGAIATIGGPVMEAPVSSEILDSHQILVFEIE
jgi:hypothetical protein